MNEVFEESEFADRFFWARTRAGIGSPTIARKIGCSSGLVSNIETRGAERTHYNDRFAMLFGVDPIWLRTGKGIVPNGFDPKTAREARLNGPTRRRGVNVTPLDDYREARWSDVGPSSAEADRADALQKRLFSDFQDYTRLVGRDNAVAFSEVLAKIAALVQPTKHSD